MRPEVEALDDQHIVLMWQARWWLVTAEDQPQTHTPIPVWCEPDEDEEE